MNPKRILEALLFASSDPIPLEKLSEVAELPLKETETLLEELRAEYDAEERAFQLKEIAEGVVLRSREAFNPYIALLHPGRRRTRLSHAVAEVLAIIAYRQPITRPQIEAIRGVDSSHHVQQLIERGLIEPLGKLEVPGRPTLYGVTKEFLQHFGLRDLGELPAWKPSNSDAAP